MKRENHGYLSSEGKNDGMLESADRLDTASFINDRRR